MSGLHSPADLAAAGLAAPQAVAGLEIVTARYAMAITPEIAGLIDPLDPRDPIRRQFVPDMAELETRPQERADPIGDQAHSPVEGIVHRYPDRVLLKLLHACPVYCRFCFRRETVGPGGAGMLYGRIRNDAPATKSSDQAGELPSRLHAFNSLPQRRHDCAEMPPSPGGIFSSSGNRA